MSKPNREIRLPFFIISAAVIMVYAWAISFGFLYYDDHIHVFENQPLLNGEIFYFWKHAHEGLYIPLVYTMWAGLFKAFGLNPAVFHSLNIALHLANSCLVFLLIRNFKISVNASLLAALLFAVHPIQVESVVWVSALKDTSFTFFSLFGIWIFICSSWKGYLRRMTGTVFVAAAILCKPTAVVLPVFICSYVFYFSSGTFRERLQHLLKSVGVMPLTLFLGIFAIQMAKAEQSWAQHPNTAVSLLERLIVVLDALGFYITKVLWPTHYYVDYARFPRNVLDNNLFYSYSLLALGSIAVLFFWFRKNENRKSPEGVFALLFGLLFFLPTSGVMTFGHQKISTTADRYMYVIMVAVAIAAAMLLEMLQSSGF